MKAITNGAIGELLAARMLRDKGYRILASNYRSRFGEIDIVAADETYIVFAEVKTRGPNALFTPREAVGREKQARILRTAQLFLQQMPTDLQPRFDVVEVWLPDPPQYLACEEINHIMGAFSFDDRPGML